MRTLLGLGLVLTAVSCLGCAGGTPQPAAPVAADQRTAAPPVTEKPKTAGAPLPVEAAPIPPAPALCKAYSERVAAKASGCKAAKTPKEGYTAAIRELGDALGKTDAAERDAALVVIEDCTAIGGGVVRALRAELAPVECADTLVEPFLAPAPSALSPEVRDALMGLGFAARIARLVREPPKLDAPFTKVRVNEFVHGTLGRWIEGQAKAVHSVSLHGSSLEGYGKGIAAVEAGLADLRFVEIVRAVPVPDEIGKDTELEDAYYGALDQALESRKRRGRDAALVGLKKLADAGVIGDERVARTRGVLSGLYAGRRIDALDSLLIPPLSPVQPKTPEEKLAARLPSFYADYVLGQVDATKPALLRAFIERGLPRVARSSLDNDKKLNPEARRLYGRALFALGSRYWRASDFAAATNLLSGANLAGAAKQEAELVAALAKALAQGPKDAADMMLHGPHLPQGVADVAGLDKIGEGKGKLAGMALFDAARLLEIARPADAGEAYFKDIASRYTKAAQLLTDPAQKKDATERAEAATATALAVAQKPKP